MQIDHVTVQDKALNLLDQYNVTEPVVDAVKIANNLGIKVEEIEMPEKYSDVAGFYDINKKTIYVEAKDKPSRKLFTVAHELGHIVLGHKRFDLLFRIPREDSVYSKEEKEANSFAVGLLMPEFMLREKMEKYNLTKNDYKRMADIFGVPIVAMKMTLERSRS